MNNNQAAAKFPFFFEYNVHKSTIPIGIMDSDYERLAATYGVTLDTLLEQVADIDESNKQNAVLLLKATDSSTVRHLANKKLVFCGDSNTSCRKSYMNIIRTALSNLAGFNAVDCAVSGYRVSNLVYNMYPNVHSLHADIAHIMIGTNDIRRTDGPSHLIMTPAEHFFQSLDFIVTGLVEDGTKVILSTLPPVSKSKIATSQEGWRSAFWEEDRMIFNRIIRNIAEKHNVVINDMEDIYKHYSPEELTIDDGIHLNELGHQLLAKKLMQILIAL